MLRNLIVGRVVLVLAVAGVFGFSIGAGTALVGTILTRGDLSDTSDMATLAAQPFGLIDYKCYTLTPKNKLGLKFDLTHQNPAVPTNKKIEKDVTVDEAQFLCMPVTKKLKR